MTFSAIFDQFRDIDLKAEKPYSKAKNGVTKEENPALHFPTCSQT